MEKATGEADPGLGFAGQGRQFFKEVEDAGKRGGRGSPPRGRRGSQIGGVGFSVE